MAGDVHEKRRKLAKRLMEMTDKLEDLNNQIYHLQQRIEVLEKKMGVSRS
jgi:predicted  nucleic acid-binding Zn-ribbon protein